MKLGYTLGLAMSFDLWSGSKVPVSPGLMKQAREFAAGIGRRGIEASTTPLCPHEFGFKSVSPGVQTLAKW